MLWDLVIAEVDRFVCRVNTAGLPTAEHVKASQRLIEASLAWFYGDGPRVELRQDVAKFLAVVFSLAISQQKRLQVQL